MDPLSAAGVFATIMGLVCNYRQEKGAREALDHQKFVEWLEYHRHEDIKNLICNTAALRTEIDNVLRADHALIIEKLNAVNTSLARLTSQIGEFRGLTVAMMPGAELSEQAADILRQLVRSKANYLFKQEWEDKLVLRLELSGRVEYKERRFVDDDLNNLVGLGLLARDFSKGGTVLYRITRNSVRFIEAMDGKPAGV